MFRFTIRDVLWLTAVVALATGWFMHAASFHLVLIHRSAEHKRLEDIAAAAIRSGDAAAVKLKACIEARQQDQAALPTP